MQIINDFQLSRHLMRKFIVGKYEHRKCAVNAIMDGFTEEISSCVKGKVEENFELRLPNSDAVITHFRNRGHMYVLCCVLCAVCSVQCAVCSVMCAVAVAVYCIGYCTVYCTVYCTGYCTVYCTGYCTALYCFINTHFNDKRYFRLKAVNLMMSFEIVMNVCLDTSHAAWINTRECLEFGSGDIRQHHCPIVEECAQR